MQTREELRKKGHDESQKRTCHERGKKYHLQKGGGGINTIFGPKYRPLVPTDQTPFHVEKCKKPERNAIEIDEIILKCGGRWEEPKKN